VARITDHDHFIFADTQALPFLTPQLAETIISIALVSVVVPKLFDAYDKWGAAASSKKTH